MHLIKDFLLQLHVMVHGQILYFCDPSWKDEQGTWY